MCRARPNVDNHLPIAELSTNTYIFADESNLETTIVQQISAQCSDYLDSRDVERITESIFESLKQNMRGGQNESERTKERRLSHDQFQM